MKKIFKGTLILELSVIGLSIAYVFIPGTPACFKPAAHITQNCRITRNKK